MNTIIKPKEYFNSLLRLGDVIRIIGSVDKDGEYIIFSDEKCGTFLRPMCPLVVNNNGEYKYIAGYATQGLQEKDSGCSVVIVGNILEDYKIDNNKINNNTMKITNLVKKILDKDTRTLVSAGFINGDLALTDEGVSELLGILFLEKKDELVKIAEEKINDSKTDR